MKTIQGPGVFLAQFAANESPFNSLEGLAHWASRLGFVGVQIPTWDSRLFDLKSAAESQDYCDEILGVLSHAGVQLTELSTHLQGQLVASHQVYDVMLEGFAPSGLEGDSAARQQWATQQLQWAAQASRRMNLTAHATFSGALAWPFFYPWPQRPAGLIDQAFRELARRWQPILDTFDECDVDVCFELHPGEDLHDGATFERFLTEVKEHPRANILYDPSHMVLQQMDYLAFLDIYHERVRAFHVKDAEFRPTGRSGVYGGYQNWIDRPGRFRSLGDGQVDFRAIFSKMAQYDYPGWAVLEWECCLKHPKAGATEGAIFIRDHIIQVTDHAFDDFAGGTADERTNRRILGLDPLPQPEPDPDAGYWQPPQSEPDPGI
ncbi:MAG TPA: sugar phosphate isomerase/epimerase [Terracidiphilus sp.]|nr:sugar phosphate isomerase/epimerase [Terracidiphilus sp.]